MDGSATPPVSPKKESNGGTKYIAKALIGHPHDGDIQYKEGDVLPMDVFGEESLDDLRSAGLAVKN